MKAKGIQQIQWFALKTPTLQGIIIYPTDVHGNGKAPLLSFMCTHALSKLSIVERLLSICMYVPLYERELHWDYTE